MNPIELITKSYGDFTQAEKKIADYLIANTDKYPNLSIATLVKGSGTSNAAVIRMCKKLGFDGFSEFKFSLNRYLMSGGKEIDISESNSIQDLLDSYIKYINLIPNFVSTEDIKNVADMILRANRISIWGINRTAQSATQLSNRLTRIGIYNKFTDDPIIMTDDANILNSNDLCILLSLNGRGTSLYPQLLSTMKNNNCPTILITMNSHIEMAAEATKTIVLPWISHDPSINFFEDQIIVYMFIEILLHELASISGKR